jgi:hypothetical protein
MQLGCQCKSVLLRTNLTGAKGEDTDWIQLAQHPIVSYWNPGNEIYFRWRWAVLGQDK